MSATTTYRVLLMLMLRAAAFCPRPPSRRDGLTLDRFVVEHKDLAEAALEGSGRQRLDPNALRKVLETTLNGGEESIAKLSPSRLMKKSMSGSQSRGGATSTHSTSSWMSSSSSTASPSDPGAMSARSTAQTHTHRVAGLLAHTHVSTQPTDQPTHPLYINGRSAAQAAVRRRRRRGGQGQRRRRRRQQQGPGDDPL